MKSAGLAIVWCGVLALLVWWYVSSAVPRLGGHEVGRASNVRGRVEFRLEQIALWSAVENDSPLFDGSIVSTGGDARAELRLISGKVLELGSDTQVSLSSAANALRSDFEVNVLVGSLKVKEDVKAQTALVRNFTSLGLRAMGQKSSGTRIRIGGKVIDVPVASAAPVVGGAVAAPTVLDVSVSQDNEVQVHSSAGAEVVIRDEKTGGEETVVGTWTPAPEAEPEPTEEPEPLPTVVSVWSDQRIVESLLAKAQLPQEFSNQVLWHAASVRQGRVESLTLTFAVPRAEEETAQAMTQRGYALRVRSSAAGVEIVKRAKLASTDKKTELTYVLTGSDFSRLLTAAPVDKDRRGVFELKLALGLEAEGGGRVRWEEGERSLTVASASDFSFGRMRISIKEQAWAAVRPTFDDPGATVTPRWFWQGKSTSGFTRRGSDGTPTAWKYQLDFADARTGPRFVSRLRSGAEFFIEPASDRIPADRTALRFHAAGAPRLFISGRDEDLVREVAAGSLEAFSAWVEARVAWIGREGEVLEREPFLDRLEKLRMGGAWDGPFRAQTKGFRVVVPEHADPVLVEWGVALGHPAFASTFLSRAKLFLTETLPVRFHLTSEPTGAPAP